MSGVIVETEAYLGLNDPACHSSHGKVTRRTETFYLDGGHSYVYLIYGMHHCFNIVTGTVKKPEAVLIRAVEPLDGVKKMRLARSKVKRDIVDTDLCNGPGKLCQAMQITCKQNGLNLLDNQIFIEKTLPKISATSIRSGPRVGIGYAGEAVNWPLRFSIDGNPFVSKAK